MEKFCIVIPIYKSNLDCVEEISLKRLYNVVGGKGYHIYLVTPESLLVNNYQKLFNNELLVESFDPEYFTSTHAYSQLCISYDFYNRFSNYEYMLIHQLDCYLFKDDINKWCKKGYDYIGGPIVSTDCGWDTIKKTNGKDVWQPYIGNGGFSLRKIETFKDICDPNGELRQTHKELNDENLKKVEFEDKYFCNDLYNFYELYIPDWRECLNFAIDMSVDVIYDLLKWKGTPMACHSVDKNIRWWKNIIPEFNDEKIINFCEEKHKEFFKLYYDENNLTYRTT